MKTYISTFLLAILLSSCNDALSKREDNRSNENPIQSSADKFIGVWKYNTSSFEKKGKYDGSMDGQLASLKILEGTEETYILRFLQYDMLFSKQDDSTLKGLDTKFTLNYKESSHFLVLNMGKGRDIDVFEKLK